MECHGIYQSPQPTHLLTDHLYQSTPVKRSLQNIRLIELLPGDEHTPIHCKFHVFSVAKCPSYIALSYTWGPEANMHVICIDGHTLPIRQNLWDALCAIRCPQTIFERLNSVISTSLQRSDTPWKILFKSSGNVSDLPETTASKRAWPFKKKLSFYWIDQICINQSDISERNHQVNLMRNIYANADTVLVWLGANQEIDSENAAIKWIRSSHTPTDPDVAERAGLLNIFNREYWTRMWIVQEIMLAKRTMFQCGGQTFLLEELLVCMEYLQMQHRILTRRKDASGKQLNSSLAEYQKTLSEPLPSSPDDLIDALGDFPGISNRRLAECNRVSASYYLVMAPISHRELVLEYRHQQAFNESLSVSGAGRIILTKNILNMHVAEGKEITLNMLIYLCGNQNCGDVRDKVFGLLSLVTAGGGHLIKADYNLTKEGLYEVILESVIGSRHPDFSELIPFCLALQRVLNLHPRHVAVVEGTSKAIRGCDFRGYLLHNWDREEVEWSDILKSLNEETNRFVRKMHMFVGQPTP